ncbi:Putative zinc metalloprotease Rip3 [BD1-7 clade bacterium]|uniref:Zinc metalloprotease n=1 Tax=BD1-7 clade bacterium TaxID=2029982 RepID=A0A5S9P6Y9_9GAMM|nr:Putative zinc metalloprotease Rip3 [BD1-7 clade bacterium]
MKWSWKLARIAGIDVNIHATFLLLVLWFAWIYWANFGTVFAAIQGAVYIITLFGCVVLHEFGHALTARRFGVVTKHITLLPIGGVAAMEKMPEKPFEEMLVAVAGPAVNLVIALLLWVWIHLTNTQVSAESLMGIDGSFAFRLMVVNIFLALFNLIPAFPMDGGRILRAALATRMTHAAATAKAATIGQGFAILFGILGVLYNPFLLLIAIFLWFGATAENQMEQNRDVLEHMTAEQAMLTEFRIVSPDDVLSHAVEHTIAGSQKDFPVGSRHLLTHVLTQNQLVQALHDHDRSTRIHELDLPILTTVDASTPIKNLLDNMQSQHCNMVAVEKNGELAGIVNLENIMELIRFSQAMQARRR